MRALFRSPLRGPWLTAVLGLVLLAGITVVAITGFLSYAAYDPRLLGNDTTPGHGLTGFYLFDWPTRPTWLYAANQGVHVTLGIVLVPVLLAKLWSVIPRLFVWPPAASPAHALERASVALLVGGGLFEFATGIANVQVYYPFRFSFYVAHFYGAWVFLAAFVAHVAIKLPYTRRALQVRGALRPLLEDLAHTEPEPPDERALAPVAPAAPTLSRRGLVGLVGGSSLALLVVTAGQSIGGPLRRLAVLAPHGRELRSDFQINKTAASVGVTDAMVAGWRLELVGPRRMALSRSALLALPRTRQRLPIACVEGWSTTQHWDGVSLAELATLSGVARPSGARVESLQRRGSFRRVTLSRDQVADPRSLLALHVNGADLTLDHGYPARIMVPGVPGVHQTKWVERITFFA